MPLTFFIHLPMKMEPIRSSETSAIKTQTPGNYPKRNILQFVEVVFAWSSLPYANKFCNFKDVVTYIQRNVIYMVLSLHV